MPTTRPVRAHTVHDMQTVTRPAVAVTGLTKIYGSGETAVRALDDASLTFGAGRFTAIMGPSGSGKSTLMHCLAGLDTVSEGSVTLFDAEGRATVLTGLGDTALTKLRRTRIGFVFQQFNLLPTLTAEQNIVLPLELAGRKPDGEWLSRIVDVLGLRDRLRHTPSQLSGGQQQRVACARALLPRPDVIFADEPTGFHGRVRAPARRPRSGRGGHVDRGRRALQGRPDGEGRRPHGTGPFLPPGRHHRPRR